VFACTKVEKATLGKHTQHFEGEQFTKRPGEYPKNLLSTGGAKFNKGHPGQFEKREGFYPNVEGGGTRRVPLPPKKH